MTINKHLIPPPVIDAVEKMLDTKVNIDVRRNFEERVHAIKDFCEEAIKLKDSKFFGRRK